MKREGIISAVDCGSFPHSLGLISRETMLYRRKHSRSYALLVVLTLKAVHRRLEQLQAKRSDLY